jgi:hypothetical protein
MNERREKERKEKETVAPTTVEGHLCSKFS